MTWDDPDVPAAGGYYYLVSAECADQDVEGPFGFTSRFQDRPPATPCP